MNRSGADWHALSRLTGTVFEAAQARLSLLQRREAELRATLAALDVDRKAQATDGMTDDAARRAGADVLWQQWIERRRGALNLELARTLAQMDPARTALGHALGRHQVTENLAKSAVTATRKARDRRDDQGW